MRVVFRIAGCAIIAFALVLAGQKDSVAMLFSIGLLVLMLAIEAMIREGGRR